MSNPTITIEFSNKGSRTYMDNSLRRPEFRFRFIDPAKPPTMPVEALSQPDTIVMPQITIDTKSGSFL